MVRFFNADATVVSLAVLLATATRPAHAQAPGESPTTAADAKVVTDQEFHLPLDKALATEVDALIEQFGAPEYHERERASARLVEIGAPAFSKLRNAYHETKDLEVILQIEDVVQEAYLNRHVYDRNGYLGISQSVRNFPRHSDDPRIPEGHLGITIASVNDDTAASRAGLRSDDVIVAFEGEPLKNEANPTGSFAERLRRRGPGGKLTLSVLRGPQRLDIDVTLGRCPKGLVETGRIQAVARELLQARRHFILWWAMHFRQANSPTADE